jgi:metal-responsive CopG/Arc/MetJ family transcriptional regulator
MGTMNFSIPDDVKDAFNEIFKHENKSAIVAELMRRAIEERRRRVKGESFYERIRAIHEKCSRTYTDAEIRKAREEGRR